jgi:hypothetical protein
VIPLEVLMPLTPDDRKNREHQGETHVRFRFAANGLNTPERDLDREWLAEIDEVERKRTEALQTEQTRFNKSTRLAAWIAAWAAIVGIIVTAGVSYAQYQMAKAEVARHTMIKEGIGHYIGEGRALMNRLSNNEMPLPTLDEVGWIGRTEDFLRTNLGDSYVNRFNDISGLLSVNVSGTDAPHNTYFNDIYRKIIRLEEFSHELP